MDTPFFDLAISGAGISGLIAGIRSQQLGLRTCILEKQKKFVDVLRGEYIQPAGLEHFKELGLFDKLESEGLPIYSVDYTFRPLTLLRETKTIDFPYPRTDNYPDHALAIPHLILKNILVDAYLGAGGTLSLNSVVENFQTEIANEVTLTYMEGDRRKTLRARHMAVSEGVLSSIAKKIPYRWAGDPSPTSFMVGGVCSGDHVPAGKFVTAASKEGLVCAFKLTRLHSRVYFYRDIPSRLTPFKTRKPEEFLMAAIRSSSVPDMFDRARFEDRVMAAPYVPKYALDPSRGPFTLLGDAAGASHPLGGMGMSTSAADGLLVAELVHQYSGGLINLNTLNAVYNAERRDRYLTTKFVSECLSTIIGGTHSPNRVLRRAALKIWSTSRESRKFCGKLFGGEVESPLDISGLFNIWGLNRDFSFIPGIQNVPGIHYGLRRFSPGKAWSEIIK